MKALAGKILVTGGAGFIGSCLVAELNRRGFTNIIVSDILGTDQRWKNLVGLKFSDYIEGADFRTTIHANPTFFGKFSSVFHLGACSSTTETNASYLIDNNFQYTKELCEYALRGDARFIYASSAATYGDGSLGMSDKESAPTDLRPLNMYGYSKHMFDMYARATGVLNRIVGLKYFNIFGPNEYHKGEMRSLINKAYHQIGESGKLKLFKSYRHGIGDGEQQRDFLYVKDAVRMTLHFATNAENASGLYNIGSSKANTWNILAHAIFHAMNMPPSIDYIDMPLALRDKYQYFTQADTSKLRQTGYIDEPTGLQDAVTDYIANYLSKGAHYTWNS